MPKRRMDEALISKVEKGVGAKYGRDARAYAVDAWKIHTGEWPRPAGWKDPYAALDKPAAKKKPSSNKN